MPTSAASTTRHPGAEFLDVNGVRVAYADTGGAGEPLVLVHGSWVAHHDWDQVVSGLAEHFRVVGYDRRGHGDSECPPGQGHFSDDVADLGGLIECLGLAPAWVAGNSAGAVVTLKLAAARPELCRGIILHEPPLFGVLEQGSAEANMIADIEAGPLTEVGRRIAAGERAAAAELFVDEVALGPGSWARMPEESQATMINNAATYLDELNDPEWKVVDEVRLATYDGPALMTSGDQSPPVFAPVESRLARLLPQTIRSTYAGGGHIPHVTHPEQYVADVVAFVHQSRTDTTRATH